MSLKESRSAEAVARFLAKRSARESGRTNGVQPGALCANSVTKRLLEASRPLGSCIKRRHGRGTDAWAKRQCVSVCVCAFLNSPTHPTPTASCAPDRRRARAQEFVSERVQPG